jgi:hypothetical protein
MILRPPSMRDHAILPEDLMPSRRRRGAPDRRPIEFLLNPYRFGGGGGASGLIDSYTTNLWGAYGLQLLRGNFLGSAIRVRRSSDNTEQDIGFTSGALNTSALASFVGANDGFVTKWYDQSGAGNDFAQATTANQPMIVDAGVYIGEVTFDGVNDAMTSVNNSGTPSAFTVHVAGRQRLFDSSLNRTIMRHAGSNAELSYQSTTVYNSNYGSVVTNGGGGAVLFDDAAADASSTYSFKADRAGALATDELTFYTNGTAKTPTVSSGTTVTGNYTAGAWYLGFNGTTNYARLSAKALLIYETAQSGADITSIATLVKPAADLDALDSFTTSLWGVYGLRRLRSTYAGSCLRVRRSSDNAEQDIGFSSGLLDTASLLSFIGANSGFIVNWYDQSGAAKNIAQSTAANQPRIVNAGVYDGAIVFDGSNDYLITANSGTGSGFSTYIKALTTSATTVLVHLEHNSAVTANASPDYRDAAGSLQSGIVEGGSSKVFVRYQTVPTGQVLASVRDRTLSGSTNISKYFSGGSALAGSSQANIALTSTANAAAPWSLGGRNGTLSFAGRVTSLAIYETAHAAATVERVSRAIG